MIQVNIADPAFKIHTLPESIFDKIEAIDLKRALHPNIAPVVDLSLDEYVAISADVMTTTVGIAVSGFYGIPSYYSVMPQAIFDALELAALNDEEIAMVSKEQFDKMIADYEIKMRHE